MDPTEPTPSPTELLLGVTRGERSAVDQIVPIIYDELRRLAHRQLRGESKEGTLTTTALVHEAYLRLIDGKTIEWQGRSHFMAVAAIAMRHILVDRARHRRALKRGGEQRRICLDSVDLAADDRAEDLLALDEALERLAVLSERQARIVECRFFAGLSEDETATALGVGLRTVQRDWAKARGWLYREVGNVVIQ